MFGADGGVIEPGRDGMGEFDLAFFVGQQKSFRSLEHTKPSALKPRGVFATSNAFATRLDADHPYLSIFEEWMKQTDGIAAAADARHQQIRLPSLAFEDLAARFNTDDALKIAHHHRVRVRAEDRAQYIMSGPDVGDPIAHRFVDRFFERGLSDRDRDDFRAKKFHARDIERLPFHVDFAHVNEAVASEPRGNCSRRDP